jgi:hypothetical protein
MFGQSILKNTKWILSPSADFTWIWIPSLLPFALYLIFPHWFIGHEDMGPWAWLAIVLLVDIAHVYATIFRTYTDKKQWAKHQLAFILIPLLCLIVGVICFSITEKVFWSLVAYLAVFHFVRQQYGLFRLYAIGEKSLFKFEQRLDAVAIYAASLGPMLYWHLGRDRNFSWMIEGDFFLVEAEWLRGGVQLIYFLIIGLYLAKELYRGFCNYSVGLGKNIILISTCLNWYMGIVYLNGDIAFTLFNVLAHGIPYLGLIWHKNAKVQLSGLRFSTKAPLVFFLVSVVAFAYVEEFFWDLLAWRDHPEFFGFAYEWISAETALFLKALVIPLLAVPQLSHYVLDGIIWRSPKN